MARGGYATDAGCVTLCLYSYGKAYARVFKNLNLVLSNYYYLKRTSARRSTPTAIARDAQAVEE